MFARFYIESHGLTIEEVNEITRLDFQADEHGNFYDYATVSEITEDYVNKLLFAEMTLKTVSQIINNRELQNNYMGMTPEELACLKDNDKIKFIRSIRRRTSCGLKEAKFFADYVFANQNINWHSPTLFIQKLSEYLKY